MQGKTQCRHYSCWVCILICWLIIFFIRYDGCCSMVWLHFTYMFKPSHIYATQYKSYNACTCSKSMTLKICINSIIITWTYINIRFFLKNKSGQSVTYYWKIQRWNIIWFLYPIITGPEIIFYNSLSNVFGDFLLIFK